MHFLEETHDETDEAEILDDEEDKGTLIVLAVFIILLLGAFIK